MCSLPDLIQAAAAADRRPATRAKHMHSAASYLLAMSAFTIRMPFTNPGPTRHSALVDDPCHLRPRSISFSFRSAMLARHPCCQNSSGKGGGGRAVHHWRAGVSRGGGKNDRRCVHTAAESARRCASKRASGSSNRLEACVGRLESACFRLWYGARWCFIKPGEFAYPLGCTVEACTRR